MFELHPDLMRDGIVVGRFPLSLVLLINDEQYPWFVLVPQKPHLQDLNDLSDDDYLQFWNESRRFCDALVELFNPDKLNVASLGNVTPQLHVHHIARYKTDASWPRPIWGQQPRKPYEKKNIELLAKKMAELKLTGYEPTDLS